VNLILKKYFLFCITLIGINSCNTQHQFNPYQISLKQLNNELFSNQETSAHDKLVKRFENSDTTLSENELILVYFGQLIDSSFFKKDIPPLFSIYEEIQEKNFILAELKTDTILAIDPINLTANNLKAFLVSQNDSLSVKSKNKISVINKLFDAILSTGDGLDIKNAIDVVSVADEYFICYNLLLTGNITGQTIVYSGNRIYDKLIVEPNDIYNHTVIWFDVSNIYKH
jgi:hypothetical protein